MNTITYFFFKLMKIIKAECIKTCFIVAASLNITYIDKKVHVSV